MKLLGDRIMKDVVETSKFNWKEEKFSSGYDYSCFVEIDYDKNISIYDGANTTKFSVKSIDKLIHSLTKIKSQLD